LQEYELPPHPLKQSDLTHVRDKLCEFILREVIDEKGEFYYTGRFGN
jgi:hypothetical protein